MSAPAEPVELDTLPARLESAASHLITDIPIAAPEDHVGDVRRSLVGRRFASLDDVAVCRGRRLVGLVTIEALMAAADDASMASCMDPDPPTIGPGVDQEKAADRMVQRSESSLAVVDEAGDLLGLIPPERMLSVLLDEHHEDLERFGGVLRASASARTSTVEPVVRRLGHRLPWLLLGLLGAMASAALLGSFEASLTDRATVALFLPAIVYLADAVGTQTETLAVRGLSVGVSVRRIVGKELVTGAIIGVLVALVFFVFAALVWGELDVALAVALSLFASCAIASGVALALPALLARLGRDPAFGSGPLATVVQDLLSLAVYLAITTALVT